MTLIIIEDKRQKMKNIKYILLLILAFAFVYTGCTKNDKTGTDGKTAAQNKEYWTCPMHPQVMKDKPGVCPICEMDLIKKSNNDKESDTGDMANMVTLSYKKQILANVSTVKVSREILKKDISVYSYLDFAEQSRKIISARFNGRIEKLLVDKTGDNVKKGQALFEIYSPDLVQAQNDYLLALSNSKKSENSSLLNAAKSKLEIYGLTSAQINEIETTNKAKTILTYFSPVSGTVIEKKVREGMYVNEGTAIYDVAELSSLWNISEVNERDLGSIKVGAAVKLRLKAYPQEAFNGKVAFVYPVVNSQSRTVKVRSDFNNTSGKLKPQMYGETVFSTSTGQGLLVSADAIIFSGKRTIVWVKMSDGMFEGHNVTIGEKYGDKYQILTGLNENDEVAASGGFLIDSESQLKTGLPNGH